VARNGRLGRAVHQPLTLGRTVKVNREPFTVIGVLPPSYRSIHGYGITSDLYAPISSLLVGELDRADNERLDLICRLRAEAPPPQVESSLLASVERWKQQFPAEIDKKHKYLVRLSPLTGIERLRNDGIPMEMALFLGFLILSGALVLLIACGNVGSLLLARGSKRSREFEVRRALGAPRFHLMRQLFVETFLLAVLGAGFGLALYLVASSLIDKMQPSLSLPVEVHLHLDLRLLVLTASVTLLTTLLVGLTPAMQARQRYALVSARQVGSALPLRRMLVVSQFALSFVLLVSAALLLRSLARIAVVDPGFDSKHVLIAELSLQLREYSRQQSQQFLRAALAEIERLPGVRSVSGATTVPLGLEHSVMSMRVGDRIVPRVHTNSVTEDYFRTMGIRLVQGRQFDETDREGGRPVAIVNESFARSYLENQPLNAGILVPQRVPAQPEPRWVGVVVVGVVADSKYGTLGEDPMPALYWPWTQQYAPLTLLIQSDSPQSSQLAVRNALARIGGQAPIKLQLMEERIAGALLPTRIASGLLGVIGTLGLILAAVGIYGVMAYSVGQRSGEIGLRLALGATPMQVLQMTLRDALRLAFIGLLLGLGLALLATRLLSGILASGMSAIDPLSLGSVGVLLSLTALCAALVPSWRAARVDPAVALRSE
jgi:putative ABC transport system permease protein